MLTDEIGGMPIWAIALTVITLLGMGGWTLFNLPQQAASTPKATSAPTFAAVAPEPEPTRAVFFGDSYTFGTRASTPQKRWTTLVSSSLRWRESNHGVSGSGYLTSVEDGRQTCGLDRCPTYAEEVASAKDAIPDFVIISGGRNDGALDTDEFTDAVRSLIDEARAKWPDAQVVVTSPLWDDDTVPRIMQDKIEATRVAAETAGVRWLDLGQPLADRPDLIDADGMHPNDDGYAAIAATFVERWGA